MLRVISLGDHDGEARRLARGVRLICRPYVERWGSEFEPAAAALARSASLLAPHVPDVDVVSWVPGHDGTPGPGYYFAEALSHRLGVPLQEALRRRVRLPSAHLGCRPDADTVRRSLVTRSMPSRLKRILLVDNVLASGANMVGAAGALMGAGSSVVAITVSIDLTLARHLIAAEMANPPAMACNPRSSPLLIDLSLPGHTRASCHRTRSPVGNDIFAIGSGTSPRDPKPVGDALVR